MPTAYDLKPFSEIPMDLTLAALPKADIHIHPEWSPRLDRVLARRAGRAPYDWRAWAENLMATQPPGAARLSQLSTTDFMSKEADALPQNFIARVVDMLEEAAADGAVLVEIRFGKDMADRPDCIALFREAEQQVRRNYPRFHAAAIPYLHMGWDTAKIARLVQLYLTWAQQGLIYGVDLFNVPYAAEADWSTVYPIAEKFAAAGLGITVHVAEVAPVNVASALRVPGLKRLGHATHAGYHPQLLELVARGGVTVECALTCNVVLGAAPSYREHPMKRFIEAGIPVVLCTDDPVRICTTIGREYAIASLLGFSTADLLGFTRNAVSAAFIAPHQRGALLMQLETWQKNNEIA